MESSSVGIESIEKVSWKEAMAKKVLLKLLSKIEQGSLTLQEADETHQFGNPNSDLKAHVTVNDQKLYWNMLTGGTIAAGECYFNGLWDSPDVTKVIRVMVRNSDLMDTIDHRFSGISQLIQRFSHFSNRNSKSQSKKNIVAHYDLGNDFYKLFLDETMMYSSAVFKKPDDTLYQAQVQKLDDICQHVQLKPGDEVIAPTFTFVATAEVIALLGYTWVGGFDTPTAIGARQLPESVKKEYTRIGQEITQKNN